MSEFKTIECRYCGNHEESLFRKKDDNLVCKCCGSWYQYKTDAESLRCEMGYGQLSAYKFDEAKITFQNTIREFPGSVDARWGLLLAQYHIVYIKGFYKGVSEPIYCFSEYDKFRTRYFRGEVEYGKIMKLLEDDDELRYDYEEKAEKIDRAINNFKACKSSTERDVFICVKISSSTEGNLRPYNERTSDYEFAQRVYVDLKKRGINPFFSFVTLKNEVDSDDLIWLNLVKSSKMLLIGSRTDYLESAWVKSEWKRWLYLGRGKDLYICVLNDGGASPLDILPTELADSQIYTRDTYDKLISDICAKNEAETEAEMLARIEAQLRQRFEEENKAKAEAEAKAKAEAEAKAKAEAEAKAKVEAEAKAKAEAEAKAKAEAKAEAAAKAKAEADAALTKTKTEENADVHGKIVYIDGREETILCGFTKINASAYYEEPEIVSVVLPASTKEIGDRAFANCGNLTSITLPESLKTIGRSSFFLCENLKDVYYRGTEKQYREIEIGKFNTVLEKATKHFGKEGRDGKIVYADGREETLKYGITEIADCAYADKADIIRIILPESVKKIGEEAFSACASLKSVTIPNGVTSIGRLAFTECTALTEIVMPNSVTFVGDHAFRACEGLESVTVSDSVTTFEEAVFQECGNLKKLNIPKKLKAIGGYCFSMCENLKSITIPKTVKSIGELAFDWCLFDELYYEGTKAEWEAIDIDETNDDYGEVIFLGEKSLENKPAISLEEISQIVLSGNQDGKIVYASGKSEVLKYGITEIEASAYYENKNIVTVVLPTSVTAIGDRAFASCDNLQCIAIPAGVKTVGRSAFFLCENLKDIYYGGKKQDYGKLELGKFNTVLTTSNIHFLGGSQNGKIVYSYGKEEVLKYGITEIADRAYYRNGDIVSVVLPESVTAIGEEAFAECFSLTSVSIPESVKTIDNFAFTECSALTDIVIPNSVTSVGGWAFRACDKLKNVTMSESVTAFEESIFEECYELQNINIPSGVTSIGDYAFHMCENLESITIPKSVKSIAYAFEGCSFNDVYYEGTKTQWNEIEIDEANDIFSQCTIHFSSKKAAERKLAEPQEKPAQNAASGSKEGKIVYKSGKEAVIGYGNGKIKNEAYAGNAEIANVILPEGITAIGEKAFYSCSALASITVPASLKEIEMKAFSNCAALKNIYYGGTSQEWLNIKIAYGNAAISKAKVHFMEKTPSQKEPARDESRDGKIVYTDGKVESIRYGKTEIGSSAFAKKNIVSVVLPAGIKRIGIKAFEECKGLKSVILQEGVQEICRNAFEKCDSLEEINLPDGMLSVGDYAFSGCASLKNIHMPNSLTTIGDGVFWGCIGLEAVYISKNVSNITGNPFVWCKPQLTIDPENTRYKIIDNVLYTIDGKEIVSYIVGEEKSFAIPNGVTRIGVSAFSMCKKLTEITVPNSVTAIGNSAFSNCNNLVSLNIPNGVTEISPWTFYNCISLTNLIIPVGVRSIGERAFSWCTSLKKVVIPNSVTTIAAYTFSYCKGLESITLPSSITNIDLYAFSDCNGLKDVYFNGKKEQWSKIHIQLHNEFLTKAKIHFKTLFGYTK